MDSKKIKENDQANYFKPNFKDYDQQFKIIKNTYHREKSNIKESLLFQILEVLDKDINRCIKNIEELFKKNDQNSFFFNIIPIEAEKKIMNEIIPAFIEKNNKEYIFEQVTLCLHFLFHIMHKIKRVSKNFNQECVLFIMILTLNEILERKNSGKKEKKEVIEKKYLFDLANLILVDLKHSMLTSLKKKLSSSLIELDLATLYTKYVEDLKTVKSGFCLNSFMYIDQSPIASEKKKKLKFERVIWKMLVLISKKYKIVDQLSNFHKEFFNSLLDFAIICKKKYLYELSEKKSQLFEIEFKKKINLKKLAKVNKQILRILKKILISKFKFEKIFDYEKLITFLKSTLSILMFHILKEFYYEFNGNDIVPFDIMKIKTNLENEYKQKNLVKNNFLHFEIITIDEFNKFNDADNTKKNIYIIKNSDCIDKKIPKIFEVFIYIYKLKF